MISLFALSGAFADPQVPAPVREHLAALGVPNWHEAGVRGQGVTIAVLDTGFRNYRDYLGKGLPRDVLVQSFRRDGNLESRPSQHGILCAEILHAMAPGAKLIFANWEPDQPQTFVAAVRWAKRQGAKIVSCSVIMPSWSDGDGGGPVHEALEDVIGRGNGAGDLLFVACAGNTAQRHWHGPFRPDAKGRHQWAPGQSFNLLHPFGAEQVTVELYGGLRGVNVQVVESETGRLEGETVCAEDGTALVRFQPRPLENYRVIVSKVKDTARTGERFHLVVLGGYLLTSMSEASIAFPGDGARMLTVGAVNGEGHRQAYSSCGPNSRLPKPDVVARVPFPSQVRTMPFAGTSAAAPQAAALGALYWSRQPELTAEQIRQRLRTSASDLGPAGHDFETGHGLIRLPVSPTR